jgi:predicted Zn-dependent protease with MMP-like domain
MNRHTFQRLVIEAINALPQSFQDKLDNVEIVVEDWADANTVRQAKVRHPADLLGFYRGIPQTKRTHHYGMVLPDKISIYQRPIEMRCTTIEQIRETIGRVVRHEIAHHFGISDDHLKEIGAY